MSTGICPVCKRRVALVNGSIGRHGSLFGAPCNGWYEKPLPPVYPEEAGDLVSSPVPMDRLLKVNEAARELGVSEAWLRRAEGRRGVPKARRDINGWRVYAQEDIARLQVILTPRRPGESR